MSAQIQTKKSKKVKNTQLTSALDFPAEEKAMKEELKKRLIIETPVAGGIPNSNPPIAFFRLNLGIKNPDGSEGDLILELDRCFSFGVGENKNQQTGLLDGYQLSISMFDRDGATDKQTRSVAFINAVSDLVKEHLLQDEIKTAIEEYELVMTDLKKINPLWYKKEKGKIADGATPGLYPKLKWYKASKDKNGKDKPAAMATTFYLEDEVDENGEQLKADPLDFIGKRCYVTAAVLFHSVFMGKTAKNIQIKVYEAEIKEAESGAKRLLKIASSRVPTIVINGQNPLLRKPEEAGEEKEEKKEVKVPIAKLKIEEDPLAGEEGLKVSDDEGDEPPAPKKLAKGRVKVKAKV